MLPEALARRGGVIGIAFSSPYQRISDAPLGLGVVRLVGLRCVLRARSRENRDVLPELFARRGSAVGIGSRSPCQHVSDAPLELGVVSQ